MAMTYDDIHKLALRNPDWDANIMAAIAMAESSGDPNVVNSIGCIGLWQINWPVWKSNPQMHLLTGGDGNKLKDPGHNMAAASIVYHAQGYKAWETYTNNAYKKFLTGRNPLEQQGENLKEGGQSAIVDPVTGLTSTLQNSMQGFLTAFVNVGLNAGAVIFATILIVLGVVILMRSEIGGAIKLVKP